MAAIETWPEVHCIGTTSDGLPCKATPQVQDGASPLHCWRHDPERPKSKRRARPRIFGTVRKLGSNRYQATYWHADRRHVAPHTFDTKGSADAYLSEVHTEIRRGTWIDPKAGRLTVKELGTNWLASDPGKRDSTRSRDETILRLHVYPTLEATRIEAVSKARIQALINSWVADKKAAHTVHRQFSALRAMFSFAVENDLISRSPCRGIKLPEIKPGRRTPLTSEDIDVIAKALPGRYRPMAHIGAVLGLRWGEVAGLRLRSIDFDLCRLTIDEQMGRDMNTGSPKTDAGNRSISMPPELAALLRAHSDLYELSNSTDFLFQAPKGGPLDYTNWRPRVWVKTVKKAGFEGLDFHDLRRAAGSALVRMGVDIKTTQVRLGHADPRTTMKLYVQADAEADQEAAALLSGRFFNGGMHVERTEDPGADDL